MMYFLLLSSLPSKIRSSSIIFMYFSYCFSFSLSPSFSLFLYTSTISPPLIPSHNAFRTYLCLRTSSFIQDTEWSPCSVTCGEGIRRKPFRCKIFLEFSKRVAVLNDSLCHAYKPLDEVERCVMEPCSYSHNFEDTYLKYRKPIIISYIISCLFLFLQLGLGGFNLVNFLHGNISCFSPLSLFARTEMEIGRVWKTLRYTCPCRARRTPGERKATPVAARPVSAV